MTLVKLSTQELRQVLMEETKKLTSAIPEGTPLNERDELKKRIEEIQRLLEERKAEHEGASDS